jgi:hypothetical protein
MVPAWRERVNFASSGHEFYTHAHLGTRVASARWDIELYALPEEATAADPAAEFFEYTMVENEVVLVDPTRMRVIDRIGPAPQQ